MELFIMSNRYLKPIGILLILGLLSVLLLRPTETRAGVFDASGDVTYKEYWVDHSEFTGGCGDDERPSGNSFYLEPYPSCEKTVSFQMPDNFSGALKAEIYLDLWRNHDGKLARFSINDNAIHAPDVGSDWSRTPYISDIALSELKLGENKIHFYHGGYHVHDIAIRIYYDDTHPLDAGSGSDVTPPDGELLTVKGDGAAKAAGAGGDLQVDNNQLTLTANVSDGTKYVEFHSYYYGFDEDNDGQMRDWHNRGRNNWYPGGTDEKSNGGTVDHAGTKATPADGEYSVNWDISHIPDQDGVKFKIRVVDDEGNVREAAGGVSNSFSLSRAKSLIALYAPGFIDAGLNIEHKEPYSVNRKFLLPNDFDPTDFESAKMVHSFWNNVVAKINDHDQNIWPNFNDGDHWQLSIKDFNQNMLWPWWNTINYSINDLDGPGAFVEEPGPVFILQRAAWAVDNTGPSLYGHVPTPDESDVGAGTGIQIQLLDDQSGLDYSSIKMKVKGVFVSPSISGAKHSAFLKYKPAVGFEPNDEVEVYIEACDLDGNCINETYSFKVEGEDLPTGIVSDDFNSCTLNDTVWEFRDPVGDASYKVNGTAIEITVPAGSNHDIWQGADDAPRIMQPAEDVDFRLSAKFDSVVEEQTQLQGFLVAQDNQNFLRFSMRHDGSNAFLEGYIFENGVPLTNLSWQLDEFMPTVVMVERIGNDWKYLYLDENQEWIVVKMFQKALNVSEVGVFAGNHGTPPSMAPAFTSSIDFFFDDSDPIDPQDQVPLLLPVEIVGAGTVQKTPLCGNPVTLTAAPVEGHFFKGWSSASGAIFGRTNPLDIDFTAGEAVTATFQIDALDLIVDIANTGTGDGGSVSVSPEKAIYHFGDEVTLTPSVPEGWEFMGWSGDVNPGDENKNPFIITMDDNLNITATFAAEPVALQIDVEGKGIVEVVPDQSGSYRYGDMVKLTAVPESDWRFDHWEGDVPGSSFGNPLELVLNADTDIMAVFEERLPGVFLPMISSAQ